MPSLVQGHIDGVLRPGLLPTGRVIIVESAPTESAPTWDPANKGVITTLTNSNTTISTGIAAWTSAISLVAKNSGKYHGEMTIDVIDAVSSPLFGVARLDAVNNTYLGNQGRVDVVVQGKAGGSVYVWNSVTQLAGTGLSVASVGTRACVSVDFDAGKIWVGLNGAYYNSGNPVTGTNPTATFTAGTTLGLAASVYNTGKGTLVVPIHTPTGYSNFV